MLAIQSLVLLDIISPPTLVSFMAGKIGFDYGLDIVDSQISDRHLNQTTAQSTEDSDYLK